MGKTSNRDRILSEGLKLVHARGFGGASVRDIVQAAGVPQGSFTNHFASKEAFGLEILDLYVANNQALLNATLRNQELAPLDRLRAYFATSRDRMCGDGLRNGCLLGNFTADSCEHSEQIRQRLTLIFADLRDSVAACLKDAVAAGQADPGLDCSEVAAFLLAALQGAILLAKAQRSVAPLERCERQLMRLISVAPARLTN